MDIEPEPQDTPAVEPTETSDPEAAPEVVIPIPAGEKIETAPPAKRSTYEGKPHFSADGYIPGQATEQEPAP